MELPARPSAPHLVFVVFLAFISAFAPISTDLYLPALPAMSAFFATTKELTNFTLSGFMLFFAASMLVWGPLSDKYGRRPILRAGAAIYIIASLVCVCSTNIYQLIAGRCLQAVGSGALSAVATAIVKDRFSGRKMENMLAIVQTLTVLAPMLAPMLGGVMLLFTSWRGIFWCLVLCGSLAFVGAMFLPETIQVRQQGSVWTSLGRLFVVLRHRGFCWLLAIFSITVMPLMAYLAVSAYIFQEIFHVTPQQYSYFFAINAASSMLGPVMYVRLLRELPHKISVAAAFIFIMLQGIMLLLFGHKSPFIFAALFLPITFTGSALRPYSAMLMLNQHDQDTGSVAALMGSIALLCGSFSMFLCSLPWPTPITALGWICLGTGLYCILAWIFVIWKKIVSV